jgi:hypothetical protein
MNLVEAFIHDGYPYACCQAYLDDLEAEMEWLVSAMLQCVLRSKWSTQ